MGPDANDDGDDDATPHFTACVALHIEHTHKNIHRARTVLFLVHTSFILTLAQVRPLSALHSRSSTCHPCVRLLHLELHSQLLSFPPVCLPLPLLPPQRPAAAGAQQEDHGKPATPRPTGVRAPTTSSTSPQNKIIPNTRLKKKVTLEEMKTHKEDLFLGGRQVAHLIYEHFQVTGSQWFRRERCRPIHYWSSK